jgi:RNA polymerase sigma-70 factor, ECF subfamily
MSYELEFNEFFNRSFQRVVGQVYASTGSMPEAEDSVQEAYLRAWQRWDEVRKYDSPEAWIRTVAYRQSVVAWRKAASRAAAHRRAAPATEVPGPSPDELALVTGLRRISPDQSRAIVLYHLLGLSIGEVATEVGVPEGTVKARLNRGRKALAPHVSDRVEARRISRYAAAAQAAASPAASAA